MAIHLLGGGWADDEAGWTGRFVAEAALRAGGPPMIVVVLWAESVEAGRSWHEDYRNDLLKLGVAAVRIVQLSPEVALRPDHLDGADGIFIGGGFTPGYYEAVMPAADAIRVAAAAGVPYAGYSAGAMIAGTPALLGGWRLGGIPVSREDLGEGLDEVALAPGLGLVDFAVDVHVAQGGLLSRAVAIADAGLADKVVGVDECTSVIADGSLTVAGQGRAWIIQRGEGGVKVEIRSADQPATPSNR